MQTHIQTESKRAWPFSRVLFSLLLIITSIVGASFLIAIALAKAMRQPQLRARIIPFNRRVSNPIALKIAGKRSRTYAALEHVGRSSGRTYSTPVVAKPLGDGFVIPLLYGADVDWCCNVMAAGGCTLRWHEGKYRLDRPEMVSPEMTLEAFPWVQRLVFARGGVKQYLWLHRCKGQF